MRCPGSRYQEAVVAPKENWLEMFGSSHGSASSRTAATATQSFQLETTALQAHKPNLSRFGLRISQIQFVACVSLLKLSKGFLRKAKLIFLCRLELSVQVLFHEVTALQYFEVAHEIVMHAYTNFHDTSGALASQTRIGGMRVTLQLHQMTACIFSSCASRKQVQKPIVIDGVCNTSQARETHKGANLQTNLVI